jgi:hypothetical protein
MLTHQKGIVTRRLTNSAHPGSESKVIAGDAGTSRPDPLDGNRETEHAPTEELGSYPLTVVKLTDRAAEPGCATSAGDRR